MNLSSLGSFSSLATTALDTARSTFKGLADAATTAGDTDASATGAKPAPAERAKAAERRAASTTEGKTDGTTAKVPARRNGALLDAYA